VTVVKKAGYPLPASEALEWIEQWAEFPVNRSIINWWGLQSNCRTACKISYWDAAILAAADSLKALIVYSEDLNNGQQYGPVRIVNPFR
jgi:predicted nucleic acid-binding protein